MVKINPLIAQTPSEVPLPEAPLIRVLAQVRFPTILSIKESSFVAPFQEAIRVTYPTLKPEHSQGVILGPSGLEMTEPVTIWRFLNAENTWQVSLAPDFIALDTSSYVSRNDFLERLEVVLRALDIHIKPQRVERYGLRYIDRLTKQHIENISKLVRPEISGILATELGSSVRQTISESIFDLPNEDGQILARWGLLPSGATIDPAAVEPIDEQSWVLDLDMSITKSREFSVEALKDETKRFAERIYTFFRWAVEDDFLRCFGGDL